MIIDIAKLKWLALSFCFPFTSYSTEYYVSKTGSDSNAGTKTEPFLTINKAASTMVAGDTCYVMEGVYREKVVVSKSGTSDDPIVFKNYESDSVVVSATDIIDGWQVFSGDVYRAKVSLPFGYDNTVFCDNKVMDWARWPNNEDDDPYTIDATPVASGSTSSLTSEQAIQDISNWDQGYLWYLGAHSGTSWVRPISSRSGNTIDFVEVDGSKWPFSVHHPGKFQNGNRGRFYLFGVLDALDYEREWYYDEVEGYLYLQAPGNVNPSSITVQSAMRDKALEINGAHVVVDGIDAFGGQVRVNGSNSILRNGYFLNCMQTPDKFEGNGAAVFTGAIHVGGANVIVENNTVDGSSVNGIFVQGWNNVNNVIIRHNYVYRCNTVGIHSSPIRTGGNGHKIISNTIKTTGRDGLYTAGENIEIAYNDISDCMRINNDGGIYYTVGNTDLKNTEIHHNWFHDSQGPSYADGRVAGIYLDNDSKGYTVHHNVVWNITWTGYQVNWANTNLDFFNNTLVNCGGATARWANGREESNNRIWNSYTDKGVWNTEDFKPELKTNAVGIGELENPNNRNFLPKLVSNSDLIDKGTAIAGITDNAIGDAPDIGAYESGLTPWIPGVNTELGNVVDGSTPPTVTSIYGNSSDETLIVYPNPISGGVLNIRNFDPNGETTVCVFNDEGKLVFMTQVTDSDITIPYKYISNSGVYLVQLLSNLNTQSSKVVVY